MIEGVEVAENLGESDHVVRCKNPNFDTHNTKTNLVNKTKFYWRIT